MGDWIEAAVTGGQAWWLRQPERLQDWLAAGAGGFLALFTLFFTPGAVRLAWQGAKLGGRGTQLVGKVGFWSLAWTVSVLLLPFFLLWDFGEWLGRRWKAPAERLAVNDGRITLLPSESPPEPSPLCRAVLKRLEGPGLEVSVCAIRQGDDFRVDHSGSHVIQVKGQYLTEQFLPSELDLIRAAALAAKARVEAERKEEALRWLEEGAEKGKESGPVIVAEGEDRNGNRFEGNCVVSSVPGIEVKISGPPQGTGYCSLPTGGKAPSNILSLPEETKDRIPQNPSDSGNGGKPWWPGAVWDFFGHRYRYDGKGWWLREGSGEIEKSDGLPDPREGDRWSQSTNTLGNLLHFRWVAGRWSQLADGGFGKDETVPPGARWLDCSGILFVCAKGSVVGQWPDWARKKSDPAAPPPLGIPAASPALSRLNETSGGGSITPPRDPERPPPYPLWVAETGKAEWSSPKGAVWTWDGLAWTRSPSPSLDVAALNAANEKALTAVKTGVERAGKPKPSLWRPPQTFGLGQPGGNVAPPAAEMVPGDRYRSPSRPGEYCEWDGEKWGSWEEDPPTAPEPAKTPEPRRFHSPYWKGGPYSPLSPHVKDNREGDLNFHEDGQVFRYDGKGWWQNVTEEFKNDPVWDKKLASAAPEVVKPARGPLVFSWETLWGNSLVNGDLYRREDGDYEEWAGNTWRRAEVYGNARDGQPWRVFPCDPATRPIGLLVRGLLFSDRTAMWRWDGNTFILIPEAVKNEKEKEKPIPPQRGPLVFTLETLTHRDEDNVKGDLYRYWDGNYVEWDGSEWKSVEVYGRGRGTDGGWRDLPPRWKSGDGQQAIGLTYVGSDGLNRWDGKRWVVIPEAKKEDGSNA